MQDRAPRPRTSGARTAAPRLPGARRGTAPGSTSATTASASMPALIPALVRLNLSSDRSSPAGDERQAQDQEQVAEDAAGDRRLHQLHQPRAERHDRDDQLGRVAEGGVEQAADGRAGAVGEVLGGLAHVARQRQHAEARGEEDPHRRRVEHVAQDDADRHGQQQQQPPARGWSSPEVPAAAAGWRPGRWRGARPRGWPRRTGRAVGSTAGAGVELGADALRRDAGLAQDLAPWRPAGLVQRGQQQMLRW